MAEAKLEIKSELSKIIEELKRLQGQAGEVSSELKKAGEDTGESLDKQVKRTENFFSKLANAGRRVADQLRGDFKTLAGINALSGALKLSSQFSGAIKETINLSDAIRKFGASFGIAEKDFSRFQAALTKGMGDIGMSSEEAGETLRGLAGTGVRGEGTLQAYSMRAAQLASLGGEKGKGGAVAGMLAGVVQAQGGNVNDAKKMEEVAKAVAKAMEGSGKSASELLTAMRETFHGMTMEQKKRIKPGAAVGLAVAETVAGPEATAALKKYLQAGTIERQVLKAQRFQKVFTKEGGLDPKALKDWVNHLKLSGLSMRESVAKQTGLSDEMADGLVQLAERADDVSAALSRTAKASDDITTKTRKHMGMQEAFQSNVNKIKGLFAGPLAHATQGLTDMLADAGKSEAGAGAVVAGGGLLAALLAGGGLKALGGGMGIGGMVKQATVGAAKREAYEQITGRNVQDVNVVNASEIGEAVGGGGVGQAAGAMGTLGKVAGFVGKAGMVGAAGVAGYEIGGMLNEFLDKTTQGTTKEGFQGNAIERLIFAIDKLAGGQAAKQIMKEPKVHITTDQKLKATKQPTRGASVAPH